MNRTRAFGLIAVVSTLMLTASIASAHGRSHTTRPMKATTKVARITHARAMPIARALPIRMSSDSGSSGSVTDPTSTPSTSPECDDSFEGSDDAFEGSDDGSPPSLAPPTVAPTCDSFDDDSSSSSSGSYDD